MTISKQEMQRQTVAYAAEAWRNQGIEEAAKLAETLKDGWLIAGRIRSLKRDPGAKMTDWWADNPKMLEYHPRAKSA